MVVEKFSQSVVNSGILRLYTAAGFFGVLIYFVLNADYYTPLEMLTWVVLITTAFKGISNLMLSLVILLFNLENKKGEFEFEKISGDIDAMLAEFSLKETNKKAKI